MYQVGGSLYGNVWGSNTVLWLGHHIITIADNVVSPSYQYYSNHQPMPSACTVFKQCKCEECLCQDGNGISMDSRLIPAHLNRVQVEHSRLQHVPTSAGNPDDLAGHLIALIITDEGPDPNAGAAELWKTRNDYHTTSPNSSLVTGSLHSLPFADLADSLGRLKLNDNQSSRASADDPEDQLPLANATSTSMPHHNPPIAPSSIPSSPVSTVAGKRVPKNDRHRDTVKALKILSNIEARTQ